MRNPIATLMLIVVAPLAFAIDTDKAFEDPELQTLGVNLHAVDGEQQADDDSDEA